MTVPGFPISFAFRSAFSSQICQRGDEYHRHGLIKITDGSIVHASALAIGSRPYDVEIAVEEDGLFLSCTCPYYQDRNLCKHIWGTILEAESEDLLTGDDAPIEPLIILDDERRITVRFPAARVVGTVVMPPTEVVAPSSPPDWEQQLQQVEKRINISKANQGQGWPEEQVIRYLLTTPSFLSDTVMLEIDLGDTLDDAWVDWDSEGIPVDLIPLIPDPLDRRIMAILSGARNTNPIGVYSFRYQHRADELVVPFETELPATLHRELIPLLAATERAWWVSSTGILANVPVTWDNGPPWELVLTFEAADNEIYTACVGFKRSGSGDLLRQPDALTTGGILLAENRLAEYDAGHADAWLEMARLPPADLTPVQAVSFLERVHMLSVHPPMDLPEELRFEETESTPRPHLTMRTGVKSSSSLPPLVGDLSFTYDGITLSRDDPRSAVVHTETRRLLLRNRRDEAAALERMQELGFYFRREYYTGKQQLEIGAMRFPSAIRPLIAEGWDVEAEGRLYRSPISSQASIKSGIDWFELHGSVDFDGVSVQLPELLAAMRKGESTVLLDDGTFGLIPEEWLERFSRVAKLGTTDGNHIRFDQRQVGLLDALLMAQPEITADQLFADVRRELLEFRGVHPVDPTPGFVGTLRPYQREGLGWLLFLQRFGFGGCLADDMGLGKTVQVLALLEMRRVERRTAKKGGGKKRGASSIGPSLIVVPKSVVFNWIQEAAHFTPELRIIEHTGPQRVQSPELLHDADVVLTTYATMRSDILMLKDVAFDYAILDESQAIKNAITQTARAARLLNARYRLALSGTPIENHLGEIWSLFEFLNPGLLGISRAMNNGMSASGTESDEHRAMLARTLRPFLLRRTKEQVASDLPRKLEQTIRCELGVQQRRLYNQLRKHYQSSILGLIEEQGINQSKIQILEALLRLRQAACHPGLVDKKHLKDESAKLETLLPMLEDVIEGGSKALVFSQFTSLLALVRHELDKRGIVYEYLDGRTRNRQGTVQRFKSDPACKLFLISLKAGGVGLNLTEAEYVFLLDPWWNPAVEAQAIDRTHRIGQTRPVFAYRLIAGDTVEERILELQETKKGLASAIIGEANSVIRSLGREDLELLLS